MIFPASRRSSMLLAVLLLASVFLLVSCQDPESEEAVSETTTEDSEDTDVVVVEEYPEDPEKMECEQPGNKTRELCCGSSAAIDNSLIKCFVLHQKKMPKKTETNPASYIKFFSCLIECAYKSKKYIGKGNALNMKKVQADAVKLYEDNKQEQDFMIDMYEYCERHATRQHNSLKKNSMAKVVFAGACKPYFMLVFLCVSEYSKKVSCPYFMWKGKKENEEKCDEMKSNCKKLFKKR